MDRVRVLIKLGLDRLRGIVELDPNARPLDRRQAAELRQCRGPLLTDFHVAPGGGVAGFEQRTVELLDARLELLILPLLRGMELE